MKNGNILPSGMGIKYEDVECIIDEIANQKAYQYKKVSYFDKDDLMQETKIKCWNALNKYNPNCGVELKVFLSVCAENRIRDIRRSIVYKHNKPCTKCPFWNETAAQSGIHDCLAYQDKMSCEKFYKHEKYVSVKLSSSHPIDIDNEKIEDYSYVTGVTNNEYIEHISSLIPSGLISNFNKLKDNNFNMKSLKSKDRKKMIHALKLIYNNKTNEEY